jgi:hypothetical protein
MSEVRIAICDKDEDVLFTYLSPVVPRKGELINLCHRGTFRILDVAYRIADDSIFPDKDLLMYAEVIVDFNNRIDHIG